MSALRDADGLTKLVDQVMSPDVHSTAQRAEVVEQLWRAGNRKRAGELLDDIQLEQDADSSTVARVARTLAVAGRKERARELAEQALVVLRKEPGDARDLRTQIAFVFARLGDVAKAERVFNNSGNFAALLVEADLLDEAVKREKKNPGVYASRALAPKLARAGRAQEAYAIARELPNSIWSAQALTAAFAIVNRAKRAKPRGGGSSG
jgi:Fe2+ or Zn2+ uptake regulation protein